MTKQHNAGFLTMVEDAKSRVKEITIDEFQQHQRPSVLIDVREEREFAAGHLPGEVHMSRGTLEGRLAALPALQRVAIGCQPPTGIKRLAVAGYRQTTQQALLDAKYRNQLKLPPWELRHLP